MAKKTFYQRVVGPTMTFVYDANKADQKEQEEIIKDLFYSLFLELSQGRDVKLGCLGHLRLVEFDSNVKAIGRRYRLKMFLSDPLKKAIKELSDSKFGKVKDDHFGNLVSIKRKKANESDEQDDQV